MGYNILVTEPIPESNIKTLEALGEVTIGLQGQFLSEEALIQVISKYDALLCMLSTPVSRKVLETASKLKIVANFAVGYNNIDVSAARELGIHVANTPDVLTESCGDFTMGLLLATTRRFNKAETYLREGHFKQWEPLGFLGMELSGKTLGIVGMGRIGQAFARRAKAFGMHILYHNRSPIDPSLIPDLDARYVSSLEELASRSDVLSLHCPLHPSTHHLIDEKILGLMPNHAILLNISRGPVVDEAALAEALHNNTIGGAGIDVYEHEPRVHPRLLTAPNTTLLPHIASATHETREAIGALAAEAIVGILQQKPTSQISNLLTKDIGLESSSNLSGE